MQHNTLLVLIATAQKVACFFGAAVDREVVALKRCSTIHLILPIGIVFGGLSLTR